VVDLDAFAIQNSFELSQPTEGDEAVALIDIGAAVMKTNVVRGGVCMFARDIPFGGNNYTEAIVQRLGVSWEQAEAAKQGQEVGVNWDDLVPALEAVSRDLSLEIQRTFDYFASTAESELSSSWGVPVEVARPFEALGRDGGRLTTDESAQMGPLFAVAVGLALRRPGDKN
jgi:type IV pilus assembly protein PilM